MNNQRLATLALLTITAFSTTGCRFFGKAPKASVPVAPAPQVTPAPPPAAQPTEAPKPAEPVVEQPVQAPPTEQPAPVKPTQPPVTTTVPPRPKPKPAAAPATAAPAPAPPAAPAPVFGEILTPRQQTQVLQAYEQSAQSARRALSQLNGRALTADQLATANRVRSFLKQADEAKTSDPSNAARLAQRAELLANNLLSSLQ